MRIYCDGIFDLFHEGHLNHFKKIHKLFEGETIHLIVGVISDKVASDYKRLPIINENHRLKMISSLLFVEEAFITDMLVIDEDFLTNYKIDYVVHSFSNPSDQSNQDSFFKTPIRLNKFKEIPYNFGISTTEIIQSYYNDEKCESENKDRYLNWKEIWENKGNENINDLYVLNGWEETNFDPKLLVDNMIEKLNINKNESIMEYGCGSGLLSLYLKDYQYYGLDYSASLVSKHIKLLNNIVFNFPCSETIFKSKYFDHVIINSTLEYLQTNEELEKTIQEIERITKKGIYIANIRFRTHSEKKNKHKYNGNYQHFVIDKQYFIDLKYNVVESLYDADRYDVYKLLE